MLKIAIYTSQIVFFFILSNFITSINHWYNGSIATDLLFQIFFYTLIIILEYKFLRTPSPTLTAELHLLNHTTKMLNLQIKALTDRSNQLKEMEEQLYIERHDLRHRINLIADLIQKDNIEEVLAYISTLNYKLSKTSQIRYCLNPILDAILSFYTAQAKEYDIILSIQIKISEELPVDATDLSMVFANAFENAIYACSKLPLGQRFITCNCTSSPRFIFEIANRYQGDIFFDKKGLPIAQEPGHGIGIRSIEMFKKKYHASSLYCAENGWFKFQMIL